MKNVTTTLEYEEISTRIALEIESLLLNIIRDAVKKYTLQNQQTTDRMIPKSWDDDPF